MPGDSPYARLAIFRATWEDGDLVDEFSGLTTADLDAILLQLEPKQPDELSGDLA